MTDNNEATGNLERELKLMPAYPALLERLASLDRLGEFDVRSRGRELQRNSFFDTPSHALKKARIAFRRRTIEGRPLATWSLKTDEEQPRIRGVATRTEIELQLDADMAPALALSALRSAARQRGAAALAELVAEALVDGGLPLARPVLESETDRRVMNLSVEARGWSVELALDRVELVGHDYHELEIEAELKRGDESALDAARAAIEALGEVHESQGSKLSRALAHLDNCHCQDGSVTQTVT